MMRFFSLVVTLVFGFSVLLPMRFAVAAGTLKPPKSKALQQLQSRKKSGKKAGSSKKKAMRKAPTGLKKRQQQLRSTLQKKQKSSQEFLRQLEQKQ